MIRADVYIEGSVAVANIPTKPWTQGDKHRKVRPCKATFGWFFAIFVRFLFAPLLTLDPYLKNTHPYKLAENARVGAE